MSSLTVQVSGAGYEGFVVIDSLLGNTSSGGVRVAPDLDPDEIRALAREMTLKYSLFRLPRGGAKAGIRMPSGLDSGERMRIMSDFGRGIAPLIQSGIYNPGMDMNCGPGELKAIYAGAGVAIAHPTDTSYFTALTAANALEACAGALGGRKPLAVSIEGFGSVGGHLARLLPRERFRITAVSTVAGAVSLPEGFDPDVLLRTRGDHGDRLVEHLPGERIELLDLLRGETDLLVPAARVGVFTETLASEVRARAIVPVANAPYRTGVAEQLSTRGVLCLPGYLCNAGGVFGSSLYDNGIPETEVRDLFQDRYRPLVHRLVVHCLETGRSPVGLVEEIASTEARRRSRLEGGKSLAEKLRGRLSRRLPRRFRRAGARRQCLNAFSALDADLEAFTR